MTDSRSYEAQVQFQSSVVTTTWTHDINFFKCAFADRQITCTFNYCSLLNILVTVN